MRLPQEPNPNRENPMTSNPLKLFAAFFALVAVAALIYRAVA